jgi:formamidopyrimidine-DNA glycosylase
MPELPEVETVRIGLSQLLPGRVFSAVSHDTDKSFPNAPADVNAFLVGASVTAVKRRAKVWGGAPERVIGTSTAR